MTETMTTSMEHPLVERITRLRGRVRLVLALFGLGVVAAAAVGGMFALIFADYLVHIPTGGRVVLLLAWIGALAFLAWRVLVTPMMTRLTDQFLASRVENVHPELSDELMSAVHFIHAGTYRKNALASRLVDAVGEKTAGIRFEEAVDFRRSAKSLGMALLVIAGVGLIAGMNGDLARIGISRWFSAHGQAWPRTTTVEFAWNTPDGRAPEVAPIGEQLLVRARVVRGGYAKQYVTLTTWSDTKSATDELLTYQPGMSSGHEFVYERTLEPDGQRSFSLKLSAGDDREQEPVTIRLAPRPVISELTASVTPPAYVRDANDPTKAAPAVVSDLLNQAGRAVEGATVAIRVKATKAFATNERGEPEVRFLDQNKDEEIAVPVRRRLIEPTVAEVSFPATKTLQARIAMRDADGFENRVGGSLTMEVVPDGLPSVVITEPRSAIERVAAASVQLEVQATDDLGLDGLKLVAEKFDSKPGDAPVVEMPLPWTERTADTATGNTTGRSQFTWNLAPLNLTPGTRLTFYAMVQDNYDVGGKRHPWVKSPAMSLQIRTDADIADARRRDLNEVKERIRTLRAQQEQTRRQTEAIRQAAASGFTTAQQKEQLTQLARQQSEEAASANAIQQRAGQIARDLKQNNMGEGDLGKLAQSVAAGIKDIGQNNMQAAAGDLTKARDAAGNQQQPNDKARQEAQQAADAAGAAAEQQQQALAQMDSVIDQLGAAGDFEAIRGELQQIKARQDAVGQETRELASHVAGQDLDKLPQELRDKLNGLSMQQRDLSNQSSDLIARMDKAAAQLQQSDPASSETLQKTSQAGQEGQVSSSQESAARSIAQNKTNDAGNDQTQAQRGLQQMLDEMEKHENRQLEQLSRDLQELIEQVQQVRDGEEGISKETAAAGGDAAVKTLGDRQGQLQMNTLVLEKRAANTKGADQAAGNIREAGDRMSTAAGALMAAHKADAIDPETKAIASLDEAIRNLQKQKDKADSQIKEKQLAEFVQQYEAIKGQQGIIRNAADGVEARRQATVDKQLNRADLVALARMAAKQSDLIGQIAALSSDDRMKDFAVVVWMNRQISDSMGTSRDLMKRTQTGKQLAAAQQNAIDRIADIVAALKEEQKQQSEFKKDGGENGGGGGGAKGGKKPPLVPPLAQLKLLKAMQMVVNAQTTDINDGIATAPDEATKAKLQSEARKLGQKQGEIKDIANKIIQDMQQQH